MELRGDVVRKMPGRSTIRFELGGNCFYAKRHTGCGWREIFKNWMLLRRPVVDASNEYQAILRLVDEGLDTLEVVGFGTRGASPAKRRSFLITRELAPVISLESLCINWLESPPPPAFKRRLIAVVAEVARRMHSAGVNHRDFYLCHLLLRDYDTAMDLSGHFSPRVFVVDLHRAAIRPRVPYRWLVKDLGSLLFSALDIGLTRRDRLRFLREYFQAPIRDVLVSRRKLLRDVEKRAQALYRKGERKGILPRQIAQLDVSD